ncbi:hypothetical protein FKP32DRAFT_1589515 [Trametes sanguinea]|nr:hypothetical protein FKP32DRAFT_1589515 [Trametes sanguinea]
MHASSSATTSMTTAHSVASSPHMHASAHPSTTAAPSSAAYSSVADPESCTLAASSPQCCHCGWRGAHAPTCPFK